jgi:1-acyl-sn-glycerol-3-phosphate acyltransferase
VLALESGASIVPANITGSFEALAKGSWLPKRREIRVRFGTPIPVDQYFQPQGNGSTQELARRITDDAQKAVEALC